MRLILIRHGRPDEGDTETPHDPPLTAEGLQQARAAAELLASEGVTRIVASPLRRARQTAEPLAEKLGLTIDTIEGWREADHGASRYRSTETLRAEGGVAWARFLADPIGSLGADPAAFRSAVLAALRETAPRHEPGARIAVFTHGLPINIVLSHALGLSTITNFLVGYGSVTRLRLRDDGGFGVSSINETAHQRFSGYV
jgi:probable phosphoglycerate mutase